MRLLLLAVVLALAGCAQPAAETPAPVAANNSTESENMTMDAVEIAVALVETVTPGVPPTTLGIEPAQIELHVGMLHKIVVTNEGGSAHDLVVDELEISTGSIAPGESIEVLVTPTEAGEFKMYCSIGSATPVTSHDERGMHGTIVVS